MTARLLGIGTAAPPGRITQEAAAEFAAARCCTDPQQQQWLHRRYQHSGVHSRGSVLLEPNGNGHALDGEELIACASAAGMDGFYPPPRNGSDRGPGTQRRLRRFEHEAPGLATIAAKHALTECKVDPGTITHLICVSCTGLMSPGLDAALINRLGLPSTISRTSLGFMGCHGGINALGSAAAIIGARPTARVLICCIELCTLHFAYGFDRQRIVANALFADGAAAMILTGNPPGDAQPGNAPPWMLRDTASTLLPDSATAMTWRIGDHGFEMGLAPMVPKLIEQYLEPWVRRFLATHGLAIGDVTGWNIHPGGPKVLHATASALGLSEEAIAPSRRILAEHGNMSSATMGYIQQHLSTHVPRGPCLALGFGPGLVFEAALLER